MSSGIAVCLSRRLGSPLQRVKSLAHEIGHALLHGPAADGTSLVTRSLGELEAESVAYVVCQSLGLDTSSYSFGYVANWQGGDASKARDNIEASGKRISNASRKCQRQVKFDPWSAVDSKILDSLAASKPAELLDAAA